MVEEERKREREERVEEKEGGKRGRGGMEEATGSAKFDLF